MSNVSPLMFLGSRNRLTVHDWIFVLSGTVSGTIFYSTVIVLLLKPFVSEPVFDFLNIWVTVACVPFLIWLGRKYILSQRNDEVSM